MQAWFKETTASKKPSATCPSKSPIPPLKRISSNVRPQAPGQIQVQVQPIQSCYRPHHRVPRPPVSVLAHTTTTTADPGPMLMPRHVLLLCSQPNRPVPTSSGSRPRSRRAVGSGRGRRAHGRVQEDLEETGVTHGHVSVIGGGAADGGDGGAEEVDVGVGVGGVRVGSEGTLWTERQVNWD